MSAGMPMRGANIADQLALHASQRPTKPAIIHRERVIDYRQLDLLVRQRASLLLEMGVQPGDVVGVALKDTPEHLIMLYAVARAGAVILPVDCRWQAGEKLRVAQHFGARRVLVEPGDEFVPGMCVAVDEAWQVRSERVAVRDRYADEDRGFCCRCRRGPRGAPRGRCSRTRSS